MHDNRTVKVFIGIQARSTSTRLPGKGMMMIGQKTVTQHVIDQCSESAGFVGKGMQQNIETTVGLVVPKGDGLAAEYVGKVPVFEGSESDVLGRYKVAFDELKPDFIVRITGDCPLIPPYVITTLVKKSIIGNLDYCSNVDERWRTDLDGWDCEVISARLFQYVCDYAKDKSDREHVTTFIRRSPPRWAKIASVIGFVDMSHVKLSVDTAEDLERARTANQSLQEKVNAARRAGHLVFRL